MSMIGSRDGLAPGPSTMTAERLLRIDQVMEQTGLSSSTIYLWQSQGKFPRAVLIGARCTRWVQSEVGAWIEEQKCGGQRAGSRTLPEVTAEEITNEKHPAPARRGRGRPRSQPRLHPD